MMTIKTLREAIAEIDSKIPEIKSSKFVFNDSQMANKLSRHTREQNAMLVTVCPSYVGFDGLDEDASGFITYFQFFILSKIDNKITKEEDEVEQLQEVVQKFLLALREHQTNDCETFGNITQGAVKIDPVYDLSQLCGWTITMQDETYTDFAGYSD